MDIFFTGCSHCGEGLLADLAKYKTVEKYLQALADVCSGKAECTGENCPGFVPLECAVKNINTGSYRWIIRGGQPARIRRFMSDGITIRGDLSEREMFISWN